MVMVVGGGLGSAFGVKSDEQSRAPPERSTVAQCNALAPPSFSNASRFSLHPVWSKLKKKNN